MNSYVLITGATGGLGKALAAECAARGWNLFLTDLSDATLQPLAAGMRRLYGVTVLSAACDLTDPAARAALWEHIARQDLQFHMLLNVAGIDYEGPFDERGVDELHTIIRLNIEATVAMTRRILEFRDPARTLRILNVSSLAGYVPMPIKAVYAASKRFLLDFSLALHQELRASDVTVTAVCPAGMPTNESCIRGIAVQGFMGQITTVNVGDVAAQAIDCALAGRSVLIPGVLNQALRILGGLLPAPLMASMLNRRWRQARQTAPAAVHDVEHAYLAQSHAVV
jgi:short-subunit dehydrogenase